MSPMSNTNDTKEDAPRLKPGVLLALACLGGLLCAVLFAALCRAQSWTFPLPAVVALGVLMVLSIAWLVFRPSLAPEAGGDSAPPKSDQPGPSAPRKPKKSNWSLLGDALAAFVVLFLLAFAWEYMRSTIKGFPKISFAPTTNDYVITMPGPGKVLPPPPAPAPTLFDDDLGIVVFFENGSHTISGPDLAIANRLARVAAACESVVKIGGFASSRMFASKDDDANLHLSDARADALAQIFRSSGVAESKIQIDHWPTGSYKTMRAKARLNDINQPSPASDRESLNRRASIRVRLTSKSCLIE